MQEDLSDTNPLDIDASPRPLQQSNHPEDSAEEQPAQPPHATKRQTPRYHYQRGCGWYLSAVLLAMLMAVGLRFLACTADLFTDESQEATQSQTENVELSLNAGEADRCRALIEARLDAVAKPDTPEHAEAVQAIEDALTERLLNDFGRTPQEMGIDFHPLAESTASLFVYEVTNAMTVKEDSSLHGEVYVDANIPYLFEAYNAFQTDTTRYLRAADLSVYNNSDPLTDENKARIAKFYQEDTQSIHKQESHARFELKSHDGVWTINERTYAQELRKLFHLPERSAK